MTQENILQHIVRTDDSIKAALDAINLLSGQPMTLFAIDAEGHLRGAVTDGDIRRALLRGASLQSPVSSAMNPDFLYIDSVENASQIVEQGRKRKIALVPVLRDGEIADILNLESLRALLPLDAVLMAGGKGERLRPLTLETPKPLLEVGGIPIIDRNVENLESFGISNIFITVNYLHEKIEQHFELRSPSPRNTKIRCVLEPCRLGTMGSVALIDDFTHDNILVMNSDLLTSLDFHAMFLQHIESGAALTMAAVPYSVAVPYAILRAEGSRVLGLEEKPTFNYFANAGVYILQRKFIADIPRGEYLDAPDFIESLIAAGENVEFFPVEGRWIDIGSPDDFRAANDLFSNH